MTQPFAVPEATISSPQPNSPIVSATSPWSARPIALASHDVPAPLLQPNGTVSPSPVPLQAPASIPTATSENVSGLTFNFQDAPWSLVLDVFAEENGLSLQYNALPPGTWTYFDRHQYSARDALDVLNDHLTRLGFLVVQSERNLLVIRQGDAIPKNFVQFVDSQKLESLGRNQLASITLPVFGSSAQIAAKEIEDLLSPFGVAFPLSSSRRLVVTDLGGYLKRVHFLMSDSTENGGGPSFVYQLKNAPAEEVAKSINDFLVKQAGQTPGSVPNRFIQANSGSVDVVVVAEKTTNSILARGTNEQLRRIQDLILELDHPPEQVIIQALLVEVELGNLDEFGVELGIQDSVLFERSVIDELITLTQTNTSPNGVQTTSQSVVSQTSQPGFFFNNQPLGNNTAIHPSRVGAQALSNLALGRVNGDLQFGGLVLSAGSESVNVLLRALAAHHHLDILSRPQIRTLHNKEALIQIGKQVPVVDGVSVTAVGSANPIIRQDQSGIILKVTPKISPDGSVMIDVKAEKSAFQLTPGTGVPIFTDATNGNVIEAPVKDITTAETSVSAQTGQTIVLGGMITNEVANLDRRVPYLSDIPILGHLFRYRQDNMKRKELLIFLTPRIIRNVEHSEQIKHIESGRVQIPYDLAEQMHGPLHESPRGAPWSGGHSMTPSFPQLEMPPTPNEIPPAQRMPQGSWSTPLDSPSPVPGNSPAPPPTWEGSAPQNGPVLAPAPSFPQQGRYAPTPFSPAARQQEIIQKAAATHVQAEQKQKSRSWLPWGKK